MGVSRLIWAASVIAPWALAFGLVVSITARADPGPDDGGLTRPPRERAGVSGARLIEASYAIGDAEDLAALPDEIEPRIAAKRDGLPVINRARKGDPFVALRPGFEARAPSAPSAGPAFADAASAEAARPAAPLVVAFAVVSPSPGAAVSLAAQAPMLRAPKTDLSDRPAYATLIHSADRARELRCLAEAIYFEARSEPEAGQAAVAQVVLNRVRSGIYPATICGVVYQDRERRFGCQFSFACEGKALRVEEPACWATATRIAESVARGKTFDPRLASAINYHAAYVRPFWAPMLKKLDRIGLHVFYAMHPGLYWAPGALNGRGDLPPLVAEAGPAAH